MGSNVNLTYYQGNKEQIKNNAKEYYEKNKEWLSTKAREKYQTMSEDKERMKLDQIKNMHHSRTDEQIKKRNAYMKSCYANLPDSKRDIIRNRLKNRYYA